MSVWNFATSFVYMRYYYGYRVQHLFYHVIPTWFYKTTAEWEDLGWAQSQYITCIQMIRTYGEGIVLFLVCTLLYCIESWNPPEFQNLYNHPLPI